MVRGLVLLRGRFLLGEIRNMETLCFMRKMVLYFPFLSLKNVLRAICEQVWLNTMISSYIKEDPLNGGIFDPK